MLAERERYDSTPSITAPISALDGELIRAFSPPMGPNAPDAEQRK